MNGHTDQSIVQTAIKIIKEFGFPVVVAGMLLWLIVEGVPGDVKTLREEMSAHRAETAGLVVIMQQVCVNGALQIGRNINPCFPTRAEAERQMRLIQQQMASYGDVDEDRRQP